MSTEQLPKPLDRLEPCHRSRRTLAPGEALFVQGSVASGLYYLVSGGINLSRTTISGHLIIIHRARPTETFAEASIFSDNYHCTATATCESTVIECHGPAVTSLMNTDLAFARTMASRFATQIQQSRRRIELLSIRSADERILAALKDGLLVDDITTFADVIGLAQETVYRALAQLSQNGKIVKTSRGQYQLSTERTD